MATARSRKWLITINNPIEHGFDHARIKAAVLDLPGILYWCLCDEQGDECETLHKGLPIDRRPEVVAHRKTFGHWEFDSVIGKAKGQKQSILTLTERKTRFEIIFRAQAKTSAATVDALHKIIRQFPHGTFQSITVDNGSEFQDCHGMEHDRRGNKRLTVYYAHPYSSWERGTNERNNRIIRRYFPKGKSLAKVTQKQCDAVAASINAMPRKVLDWHTAQELFEQEIANLLNSQ